LEHKQRNNPQRQDMAQNHSGKPTGQRYEETPKVRFRVIAAAGFSQQDKSCHIKHCPNYRLKKDGYYQNQCYVT
jgi:hypothetical protein